MGRIRKPLKPSYEGNSMVVRFAHPLLKRTVRVNLGSPGRQAQDHLDALNRIFLDERRWHERHDDAPKCVREAWLGPTAGVVLTGDKVTVSGETLPSASAAEQARLAADCERLEHENLALRAEVRKLRRQLEDVLGRKVRTGPAPKLEEAITYWLSTFKGRSKSTNIIVKSNLERFRDRFGATTPVDYFEEKEREIDAWVRSLTILRGESKGTPVGPEMRKKVRYHVLTFLRDSGVNLDRKLIRAPKGIEFRSHRGVINWLERPEAEALAKALPPYWSDLFRVQVATGLRPNELITLKKADFSSDFAILELSPLLHLTLKTGPRRIRIPEAVRSILKRRSEENDVVFPDPNTGVPWRDPKIYNRKFKAALNSARTTVGIKRELDCRVGRRTCASLLIRQKMSVESVAAILGNSPQMIRDHYGRILPIEVDPSPAALSVDESSEVTGKVQSA